MLGDYLGLFTATETTVYVFMEIVTKTDAIRRVIFKKANFSDYIFFIMIFGGFSILGTYLGMSAN